jgi:HEAT repeat protein
VVDDERREPAVRAVSATALAYLRDVESADVAARVAATATNGDLLAAVLRILERVGRGAHAPAARTLLASPDPVVRAAAAAVLGRIGEPGDLERLRSACEDGSRWVALHAARALRNAGDTQTLQRLASSGRERATLAMQVLSEVDR